MIQNLEEINKELKIAHDKRKEEKKKEYDARNLITPNEKRNARIEKLKTEEQSISLKKRNTVKIFKEMKVFLKDLLPKISTATNEGRMTLLVLTSIDLSFQLDLFKILQTNDSTQKFQIPIRRLR